MTEISANSNMDLQFSISETGQATAKAFADYLIEKHKNTDQLHIALSGGSTPKILFDLLAKEYDGQVDWSKIHLYWGDERCVPPTDEESNYKMTVDHLLSKVDIPESNVNRVFGENDPVMEAERYGQLIEDQIEHLNDQPVFDIIILGMGTDGHTASIFPHEMELLDSPKTCEVANHPESGQKRVTLTGPVINAAKSVCFLVTGDSKKEKLKQIVDSAEIAKSYPAFHINPSHGELIWFIDESAASLLK